MGILDLDQFWTNENASAVWGDPAGNQRSHSDERTALEIMNEHTNWNCKPAPTNDITMRREVVVNALNRMIDGYPGIVMSPQAATIRKGFAGGYHYKFIRSANGTQTFETPAKNRYSHVHDALQYLLLGGGEHDVVLRKVKRSRSNRSANGVVHGTDYDIFDS